MKVETLRGYCQYCQDQDYGLHKTRCPNPSHRVWYGPTPKILCGIAPNTNVQYGYREREWNEQ